jgi:hypothetical protein
VVRDSQLEAVVEKHFCEAVWAAGGCERKVQYLNRRGCADRLVGFPFNRLYLVELKRPKGGRISPHQEDDERYWAQVGVQKVYLYTVTAVNQWIARVTRA